MINFRDISKNKNFNTLDNKIYFKENFISQKDYTDLLNETASLSEEEWFTHPTGKSLNGKISINLNKTATVGHQLIDLIIPEYWINDHRTANRIDANFGPIEFGWEDWSSADFVAIYYYGEWSGGNLKCYLEKDKEPVMLNVKKNVMYLLPIKNNEKYISEPVLYGTKYSFCDWIYKHSGWALG
jgi:hypothetical protein